MVDGETWKYDEPEVENVTRGRTKTVTFSTEGRPISMCLSVSVTVSDPLLAVTTS